MPARAVRARRGPALGRRLTRSLGLLASITVVGTIGYLLLGLSLSDAFYQTIITVSTVGYREIGDAEDGVYRLFTIVVIMGGVGTAFYTLGVLLETLVEGGLTDEWERRRMQRQIDRFRGHTIVCGWGRVGRTIAHNLRAAGGDVVVVESDTERLEDIDVAWIAGDATDEAVLERAGLGRARALVTALDTDAANVYVVLIARAASPELFVIARAHAETA